MKWRALALALAAVAAAAPVGGCGIEVAPTATPSGRPVVAPTPSPTPSPSPTTAPATPAPGPSAAPSATPSATPSAVAAAARSVAAAARVKAVLPRFDELAREIFTASGVPGAAVAVVAGDSAVYVGCYGVREAGAPEKVDKDTLFQLAAVSKGFTTAMFAALVSEREIGWDDPVEKYWPAFALWDPWVSRHVTFRDLVAQRSGLPAYAGDELERFGYDRQEILRRLRYLPPAAGFRAAAADQNALPTAAAVGAARATGEPWVRLVRTRLLAPLGMEQTALTYKEYLAASDRAASHTVRNGSMQVHLAESDDIFAPAGGVSSTISDMATYVRMQLNEGAVAGVRVADKQAIAATHAATTVSGQSAEGTAAAALGWETASFAGRLVVRQAGDFAAGTSALVTMVPADGVGVVVLGNAFPQGRALAVALANTLLDLYTTGEPQKDWLAEQQSQQAAVSPRPYQQLPEVGPGVPVAPRARLAYVGVYENAYYGRVTVSLGPGTGLRVKLGRGETLRYVPWDGDTWRQPRTNTAALFRVGDGVSGRALAVRIMALDYAGRDGLFRRVR